MNSQIARFTGGVNSILTVMMHRGKRGHNLKVSVRTPGEKTTTGMRSTLNDEAAAQKQFETLCANAIKQGWTPKAGRSTFFEMPAPPTTETLAATAKAAKKGKK